MHFLSRVQFRLNWHVIPLFNETEGVGPYWLQETEVYGM